MSTSASPVTDQRAKVAQAAIDAMIASAGNDYKENGRTTDGFDCSGFVSYVLQQVFPEYKHIDTAHIATSNQFVKVDAYRPGDLIFLSSRDGAV
jgi:cell wall-associated NlpC family hydrolase